MMDFITIPLTIGICIFGFYKALELFARRKERMSMINKFSAEDLKEANLLTTRMLNTELHSKNYFPSLRLGSLIMGLGMGLLVAFIIFRFAIPIDSVEKGSEAYYFFRDSIGAVYGASTLLFGGLGLIIGFIIEHKMNK